MVPENTKSILEAAVERYNDTSFVDHDPIAIPHQFTQKEDIEIMAFLVATLAWGNRKSIIKSGLRLVELFENSPYEFVSAHSEQDLASFTRFVHRTFNGDDLVFFVARMKTLYRDENGLEGAFSQGMKEHWRADLAINAFRYSFLKMEHLKRTEKHLADPLKNSAAKRLNMFLRWMVRKDQRGVDFGIWTSIPMPKLSCPLDVHSGRVARKLGLLDRVQNDWKAVRELDKALRQLDPLDPVKYDFALFGLGEDGVY